MILIFQLNEQAAFSNECGPIGIDVGQQPDSEIMQQQILLYLLFEIVIIIISVTNDNRKQQYIQYE